MIGNAHVFLPSYPLCLRLLLSGFLPHSWGDKREYVPLRDLLATTFVPPAICLRHRNSSSNGVENSLGPNIVIPPVATPSISPPVGVRVRVVSRRSIRASARRSTTAT